jgi:hypothetical protein
MYIKLARKIKNTIFSHIDKKLEEIKLLQAKQLIMSLDGKTSSRDLRSSEFKVFSQWGEDGIIQWIISKIPDIIPTFIEFGVEDYQESNTRFLLINNNWRGLIIDGSEDNINKVRSSDLYWQRDVTAIYAFIQKENINGIFVENNFGGNIGILSIDIDGNDYWIWNVIDSVTPQIVICEYNSVYGAEQAVVIPYQTDFTRNKAHYSNLYYGASLAALQNLAAQKGYSLIGSNSAGNNAFFVRNEYAKFFEVLSVEEAYVESKFRESRDLNGRLDYLSGIERLRAIKSLPLLNLKDNRVQYISDIYTL